MNDKPKLTRYEAHGTLEGGLRWRAEIDLFEAGRSAIDKVYLLDQAGKSLGSVRWRESSFETCAEAEVQAAKVASEMASGNHPPSKA